MVARSVTLEQIAKLINEGHSGAKERWEDLKADFDAKHEENRERRHALVNKFEILEGRLTLVEGRTAVVETKLTSIVGDNSGGSGLLHEIDKKVDTLSAEFAGIKKVLVFLAVILPIVVGILALIYSH